jgi:hypothetical protein
MSTLDTTASTTTTTRTGKGLHLRARRILRGAIAAATVAVALVPFHGEAAAVEDPPAGEWSFTLYRDARCEDWELRWNAAWAIHIIEAPSLGAYGVNDEVSSWSFCNDTPTPLFVTVKFYEHANYGGSSSTPANHVPVVPGLCVTGNHVWLNDALSSLRVIIEPS